MVRVEGELAGHFELRDESFLQRAVQLADASGALSCVRERHALIAEIACSSAKRKSVDCRFLHNKSTGSSRVGDHRAVAHRLHGEMGSQRGASCADARVIARQ
jgi:hypothetical protein